VLAAGDFLPTADLSNLFYYYRLESGCYMTNRLNLRLSKDAPQDEREERGIDEKAVEFHKKALPITEASDGVKAFTGMITEMY
jgi:hypothetical protein